MKKRGLFLPLFGIIFIILLGSIAIAAENETSAAAADSVDKAYTCLEDQVKDAGNLSLKEATFSVLALGATGNLVNRVESFKDMQPCWPKGACKVKETAQVALAYKRVSKDTSSIENWLLSKNASATDLKWFLEIDITNKVAANCTINDGQRDVSIKILDDAKLQGNAGSCMAIDNNGYMLRINNNCLKNTFKITCNQDFITAIVYQKSTGGTMFVPPESHSAASLGSTEEKVSGECLKTDNTCDYEGTLWAALALQKMEEDVTRFAPYLLALADDNVRYFPNAFLYIIVGGEDQYNLIVQEQKQGKFWEMTGTRDGRYHDTSLAMMALTGKGAAELDNAKNYLLSIQTKEGCWNSNNIRDTAFVLYSGWPKAVAGAGEVSSPPPCEPQFSCENGFDCTTAGGTIEYDYACSSFGQVCCSVKVQEQTCAQKGGFICTATQQCQGRTESASDGSCCLDGACLEVQVPEDTCTPAGGTCLMSCGTDETESTETCLGTGEVCCLKKAGGSKLWIWIVLLVILIALVVLGIIYRAKVKIWWAKFMEWFKTKILRKKAGPAAAPAARPSPMPQRPGFPFAPAARPMMPAVRPVPPRVLPRPKDKEMEEALRKLREISKK